MIEIQRSRQTLRIQGFSYKSTGKYFVTFCTNQRSCLFGNIDKGILHLNAPGKMVYNTIINISNMHLGVNINDFIVMPNHIHAIIIINNHVGPGHYLGGIVKSLKTYTTNCYIHGINHYGWQPFNEKLWQRGYYERIIRDEHSLIKTRQYIINNPSNWNEDNFSNTDNNADP